MNKGIPKGLGTIFNNKTLGSTEIVRSLNQYLLSQSYDFNQLKRIILMVREKLGHFEAAISYVTELENKIKTQNKSELLTFLKQFKSGELKKNKIIFDKIYPELKNHKNILTLSRSSTVLEILKLLHHKNKKLSVIVCESRPQLEGRLTASDLAKAGIKVNLITDAMMALKFVDVDSAIIGADAILKNGNVVNKVGSKLLAILCKEFNKPFYVVSTKAKKNSRLTFKPKEENPDEIWVKKIKNLSRQNIYFEVVEKKYINRIFTD